MKKSRTKRRSSPASKPIVIREGILRSYLYGEVPFARFMKVCSYKPEGSFFMAGGGWDGTVRLANRRKDGSISFPSGLMTTVITFLSERDLHFTVSRLYSPKIVSKILKLNATTLRPYQNEAVKFSLNHRRGIIKLPTAAGKTNVGVSIIRSVKRKAIMYTHKKDMLYQMRDVVKKEIGNYVGIVGDGRYEMDHPITIGSIKTIFRNMKRFKPLLESKQVLIADEVHHASSTSWYKVLQKTPAHYRIGLTATPLLDSRKILLEATTGPIIYTKSAQELIDQGYISEPIIVMLKVRKDFVPPRYDFQKAYSRGIVYNAYRNERIIKVLNYLKKHAKHLLPAVVMIKNLDHMKEISRLLDDKFTFHALRGSDTSSRRSKVYKEIDKRKVEVVVVSTIFDEAIDVSNVRTLIKASAGKSDVRTIQNLGRGMRLAKGKDKVLLIDFFDETHYYLEKHSRKRRTTYRKEGYDVEVVSLSEMKQIIEDEF